MNIVENCFLNECVQTEEPILEIKGEVVEEGSE
jgi:hypothetical protein